MQTARRLYLYVMAGISLGVLVYGLRTLLGVLLEQLGLGPAGGSGGGGDDTTGQELTLALALITVSVPVWLIHWFVIERGVRPGRPSAEVERNSIVRGLYFAVALGLLLLAAAVALSGLLTTLVLSGTDGDTSFRSPAADLAMFVVAGAAWGYHVAIRSRDWAIGPIVGAAAFLPRAYVYVAAFIGLLVLLFGINGLIELLGRVALDEPPEFIGGEVGPWWAYPLASAISGVVVGGAVWLGHSFYAERLRADTGWRGQSERPSKVRLAYFVGVIAASAIAVIFYLAMAGRELIAVPLGVSDASELVQQAGLVVLPALSAVTFAVVWFAHRRRMGQEAATFDSADRVRTADRLALHAVALVGLAYASVGVAWLLGLAIELALGGVVGDVTWRRDFAQFLPIAVVGSAVWLWSWSAVRTRYAQDPAQEAASTTRRTALLLVLGASVLAGIGNLGFILYRLFGSIVGIDAPADMLSELSVPIGGLAVATLVAAHHGILLRRDQDFRTSDVGAQPSDTEVSAVMMLRLVVPPGADADAALAVIREHLPAGSVLEAEPETRS